MKELKWLATLLICFACSPSRHVVPLEPGEHSVSLALGGPLITYSDLVIPVPLSSVAYGYGLSKDLTLFGSVHSTALLFGVVQTDVGATYFFNHPPELSPGIAASFALNGAVDTWEGSAKIWPQIDLSSRWKYGNHYIYGGLSNWFELASKRALGQDQRYHWIPGLFAGHLWRVGVWDYGLELRWTAPGIENTGTVVDYHGISDMGSIGVQLSIGRRFE